jgi:hypothetical protein
MSKVNSHHKCYGPVVYSLHALHSAGIGTATMLGVLVNTKLQIQNSEQELVQLKV